MKTSKFSLIAIASMVLLVIFMACKKDDDTSPTPQTENKLEKNYFTIPNATFEGGDIPYSEEGSPIEGVNMNSSALPGGTSYITIESEQIYEAFYVSVDGIGGYYKITPEITRGAKETISYNFIVMFSQNLSDDFTLQLSALLAGGSVSGMHSLEMNYVEAGTGALQVSLSFDQLKDVDLYVVQPDGEVIYYANEGEWDFDEDYNIIQLWGLDVDSNAGCSIDSINNENIYYPAEYIQPGKYEVWVNMYSNCTPRENPTNWIISTIYEGNLVTPSFGTNPASGTFAIDEPSNTIGSNVEDGAVKVMEFTVIEDNGSKFVKPEGKKIPLSESAKDKLEMAL